MSIRTATITTTTSPARSLTLTLWATDGGTDCAAHASGAVAGYFAAHPCRHQTRYLWTTPYAGHQLALSVVSITTQRDTGSGTSTATSLVDLESAPRTRGLTDLLVDDSHHPDFFGTTVPHDATFAVVSEDDGVAAVHGWNLDGTPSSDPSELGNLERGLFLTPASADMP